MNIITIIILAIIFSLVLILFTLQILNKGLRKTTIDLIVDVESKFKDNEQKFNTVVNGVLMMLPSTIRTLIPTKLVEILVQKIFDEIKIALDYKKE